MHLHADFHPGLDRLPPEVWEDDFAPVVQKVVPACVDIFAEGFGRDVLEGFFEEGLEFLLAFN
jgi:hypothetical protein